ncbi:MAG: hypothetical protein ACRD0D_01055, partial [Acidimicrobiales bacterium]
FREPDETGAVSILAALLAVFVLLPLVGVATTAYVRAGSLAELRRAADAGALAGAASIPLASLEFVEDYLAGTPLAPYFSVTTPDPLAVACDQALAATGYDGLFGDRFGPGGGGNPVACTAEFLPDPGFTQKFSDCVQDVTGLAPGALAGLLPVILPGVVPFPSSLDSPGLMAVLGLKSMLPAIFSPRVKVTLTRGVRGPLEGLSDPSSAGATQTVSSVARRRIKNAVVVPGTHGNSAHIGLTAPLALTRNAVLAEMDALNAALTGPILSLLGAGRCSGDFTSVADDLADLVNPPETGGLRPHDIIEGVWGRGDYLLVFKKVPGNPTGPLKIPALDLVPVCVERLGNGSYQGLIDTSGCIANAQGAFRASLVRQP